MARTRSKLAAKDPVQEPTTSTKALPPSAVNPPKLFILPNDASPEARIVTLLNPVNATPNRYLFCPEQGFYEFTKIAAPRKAPRSWLIAPHQTLRDETSKTFPSVEHGTAENGKEADDLADGEQQEGAISISKGYITKSADLFVATPLDTLFLLLPALSPSKSTAKDTQKQLFLSLDDHLETLGATTPHLGQLLQSRKLRDRIEERMSDVCDMVNAGEEKMYRLSHPKLLIILLSKAERMSKNGFPASMEDRLIRPALEIPIMSIKREESDISTSEAGPTQSESQSSAQPPGTATPSTSDSQSTNTSVSTAATSLPPTATELPESKPTISAPEGVLHLLRLRTALAYLLSSYVPSLLHTPLRALLSSSSPINFSPLDAHLAHLTSLRAQATALRSLSDNISRKRGYNDDEEAVEARAEKKRKQDEDEKKKKNEPRGIKQLKKVDVSGMRKLSTFFGKAHVKK
ncbi:hypothetical protein K432DRAFT_383880 [Lepidopterella palustris CBS 459.81]|uniref:Ribonuclease H2 subunit B n=1 Tax=Lepidopterella palustris CBS 459.81 TaxID=1314670 RepID=A0A8E2E702_9PEZI|nr:hypothetical protein K432DRAFT_383880 [Lepidopterella palustris CBS 459.81]